MSLTRSRAVRRAISSARSSPIAVWSASARSSSSSPAPKRRGRRTQSRPSCSSDATSGVVSSAAPSWSGHSSRLEPPWRPRESSSSSSAPPCGRGPGRARRVRCGEAQLAAARLEPEELAQVRLQQRARARRRRLVQALVLRRGGEPLRDLGELGERGDALARLLVELRVLDRAADQRRGVGQQVDVLLGELARRGRVQHDHADHVARRATSPGRPPSTASAPPRAPGSSACAGRAGRCRGSAPPPCARRPSRSRPRRAPSRSGRRTCCAPARPRAAAGGRTPAGRSGTRGSPSPRSRCRRRPPAPRRSRASRRRC